MTSTKSQTTELTQEQWRLISYLNFKVQCVADQETLGIRLDFDKAVKHRDELLALQEEKVLQLQEVMPKIPKITKKSKPKVTHKKDGTLSAHGEKWFKLLKDNKLPMDYSGELEVVTDYVDANPNSTPQVKEWLYSLGWKPTTFKHVRDKATGDERKIEQIRKDSELCSSVKRLSKDNPHIDLLEGLTILQHRLGMFQAFIDCSYVKPDDSYNVPREVYVKSEIGGLTNTLRSKHKRPIANMPKVGVAWGAEIRGCLIATDGEEFCGSDLVGIESTTRDHYIKHLDPDLVEESSADDYDPHLKIAMLAGMITQEDYDYYGSYAGDGHDSRYSTIKDVRQKAKTVNYAAMYGVGAKKLARETGMGVKEAQLLLDTFWQVNWAVKEVAENSTKKILKDGSLWLFNPVSNFWYSLRFDRDAWSTLNQSSGVYVFDTWMAYIKKGGEKVSMAYHDEVLIPTKNRKQTEEVIKSAMEKTNQKLKLNVVVECDSQYGPDYASVH